MAVSPPHSESDPGGRFVTVRQGDCVESIAFENGLFWETVWNHPNNAELKSERRDPNALLPGDTVYVPEPRERQVACQTARRHSFRRRGVPSMLRLRILAGETPRANEVYTLEIDREIFEGRTDSDGRMEQAIAPNARRGRLLLGKDREPFPIVLGRLDPVTEVSGIQGRLANLGFYSGDIDGRLDESVQRAIKAFQGRHGLGQTGTADPATQEKLVGAHGC